MPRLSFSLRDVFWMTLVVGMGVGWWVDHRRLAPFLSRYLELLNRHEAAVKGLQEEGIQVYYSRGEVHVVNGGKSDVSSEDNQSVPKLEITLPIEPRDQEGAGRLPVGQP